jgi:hypothetical protein
MPISIIGIEKSSGNSLGSFQIGESSVNDSVVELRGESGLSVGGLSTQVLRLLASHYPLIYSFY